MDRYWKKQKKGSRIYKGTNRRWPKQTLRFGSLLLLLAAVGFVVHRNLDAEDFRFCTEWFRHLLPSVSQITIEADADFDREEILQTADIHPGDLLLSLSAKDVVARVTDHPLVREASLQRELSGKVQLNLKLRKPVAIVAGEQLSYVDRKGYVFKLLGLEDNVDFPVITGLPDHWEIMTDDRQQIIRSAIDLLRQTKEFFKQEGQTISEIHVDALEGLSLFTDGVGGKIIFGLPPFDVKVDRLKIIFHHLRERLIDIDLIDLDYNKRAFVKMKQPGRKILAQKGW